MPIVYVLACYYRANSVCVPWGREPDKPNQTPDEISLREASAGHTGLVH